MSLLWKVHRQCEFARRFIAFQIGDYGQFRVTSSIVRHSIFWVMEFFLLVLNEVEKSCWNLFNWKPLFLLKNENYFAGLLDSVWIMTMNCPISVWNGHFGRYAINWPVSTEMHQNILYFDQYETWDFSIPISTSEWKIPISTKYGIEHLIRHFHRRNIVRDGLLLHMFCLVLGSGEGLNHCVKTSVAAPRPTWRYSVKWNVDSSFTEDNHGNFINGNNVWNFDAYKQ